MKTSGNLSVKKTARYSCLDAGNKTINEVWLVCHGYGHLSNYFISKFDPLHNEHTLIVAPEGLHRFYLNGVNGRVGASWMTKEDREKDIEDYIKYLDLIYETLIMPRANDHTIINCLGFSQGGATISRWAGKTKHRIDNLILWASVFPPDMKGTKELEHLKNKNLFIVVGDEDEYISDEQKEKELEELRRIKVEFTLIEFKGKHQIEESALIKLREQLSFR
jgi:predicted esterase